MTTTKKKKPSPPAPAPASPPPPPAAVEPELSPAETAALAGAIEEATAEATAAAEEADPMAQLPLPARVRVTVSALLMMGLQEQGDAARAAGNFNAEGQPVIDPETFFAEVVDPILQVIAVDVQGLEVFDLERVTDRLVHWWTSPPGFGAPPEGAAPPG
jgi:hypothetical protein